MINTILTKIFGTRNDRELKRAREVVGLVAAFEPELRPLSDEALRARTAGFRERLAQGQPLDELLPEAFAVVREAGRRVLAMRHFDVQLIGGMALHHGQIAEMKTGEGKTLVATLPVYLNALGGKGVHVVTVNDYLARRDCEWMGRLYRFLGLSVGVIQHDLDDRERQVAYGADITYGTNNEFGFDYLRDNMKFDLEDYVQRGHHFAIVDEVDSILIDEARTPLIISGPAEESTDKYYRIDQIIPKLKPGARIAGDKKAEERVELEKTGDYIVDEKAKTVDAHRGGHGPSREAAGRAEPVRALQHGDPAPRQPGAAGPQPVPARRRLRRARTSQVHHRRRVHRPPDARPALVGRPAPGGRGQGEGQDRAREPDPRHDHLPELLPHVQEARRHDRHGRDRGRRVRQDLQARGAGHPDQPAHDPRSTARRGLPHRAREVRRGAERDQGAARLRAAVLVGTISIEKSEQLSDAAQEAPASSTWC